MSRPVGWDEIFDPRLHSFDSLVPFLSVAHMLAAESKVVVEVGCGRGGHADGQNERIPYDLRGPGRTVIGIDIDPAGQSNPIVDEFRLIGSAERWPLEDAAADLAVSDFVLEHVTDPVAFVSELYRVLRPNGAFVARTVSRYSLLAAAARAVPNNRHADILARVQPGRRQARDVFPTQYKMNSERALHSLLDDSFDWTVAHRGGLQHYLGNWPRLARAATAIEPRLPRAMCMTMVIYARKR